MRDPAGDLPDRSAVHSAAFRADASPEIGGGHVQRCLALADAMAKRDWHCTFFTREPTLRTVPWVGSGTHTVRILAADADEEAEAAELRASLPDGCSLLVCDHYRLGEKFESACRRFTGAVLVLDDRPTRRHDCDLILDPTPGRQPERYHGLVPEECRFLLGPMHALLRDQFAEARDKALERRKSATTVNRVIVSMGMTDPDDHTRLVLKGLSMCTVRPAVDVVLGSAAAHLDAVEGLIGELGLQARVHLDVTDMAGLMLDADLAIGAVGSSSFERCCLGLPTLTIITADNQQDIAESLAASGAIIDMGWGPAVEPGDIAAQVDALAQSPARLVRLSSRSAAVCDGLGAERVTEAYGDFLRDAGPTTHSVSAPNTGH